MQKKNFRGPRSGAQKSSFSKQALRLQQIEEILECLLPFRHPADAVLSKWFREHRRVGGRDRSELAESIFDILRNLRLYRHFAQSGEGSLHRRLALLGMRAALGDAYIGPILTQYEAAWLSRIDQIDLNTLPPAIQFSLPDWLAEQLATLNEAAQLQKALNAKAPLDIRVNPLKLNRDGLISLLEPQLAEQHISWQKTQYSPWGLRLFANPPINKWPVFECGQMEVQDEGSQLLCALVSPRKSEMVVDFCAGAGGKSLLLGALMKSGGRLYALDISEKRLRRARPRIARSGLSNISLIHIRNENDVRVKRLAGKAHRVLVDAPCSGVGTLRRNPDLKWRQTPATLRELTALQTRILDSAARCVMPGGRLVYSTCSVLPQENEEQISAFLANHPDFELLNAADVLGDRAGLLPPANSDYLSLRPDIHGTDGFFAAVLQRKS